MNAMTAKSIRAFLEFMMSPLTWVFLGLLLASLMLIFTKGSKAKHRVGYLLLLVLGIFYVTATPWLPDYMITRLESQYSKINEVDKNIHWVVVLGGGSLPSSTLTVSDRLNAPSLKRVLEGLRLYRELPDSKLILSGGGVRNVEHSSAKRYDDFVAWLKVPEAHRVLLTEPVNTHDEAEAVAKIVGDDTFYLVTSASHMPRAMKLFTKAGLHPVAAPCQFTTFKREEPYRDVLQPWLPDAINFLRFNAAWHEGLGELWATVSQLAHHQ